MSAVFGNWGMSIKRRRIAANVKQYVDATNLLYRAADVEAPLQVPTPIEGEAMMQQAMLRVVRALEPYGAGVRAGDVQSQFTSMQTKRTAMQSMLRALLPKAIEQSKGLKKEQLVKMNALLGRLGDAFVTYSTMAQLATLLESAQVEAPVQAQPPAVPRDDDEDGPGEDEPMEQEPCGSHGGYGRRKNRRCDSSRRFYCSRRKNRRDPPANVQGLAFTPSAENGRGQKMDSLDR